jgi:hypothetical protein
VVIPTGGGSLRQDIILPNVDQKRQWPRLIGSRFSAAIGVLLTGFVATQTLRAAFWRSPRHFHWLLPVNTFLSARVTFAVNVVFYVWLLWIYIVFMRALHGKERVLVMGWVLSLLLSLIQGLVPVLLAVLIQYVRVASITVAFFAAVAIFVEGPINDNAAGNNAPE